MSPADDPWDPTWPDEEPEDQWFPGPDEGWDVPGDPLEGLPPELGAAVGGALTSAATGGVDGDGDREDGDREDGDREDGGAGPVAGIDPAVSRGAAEALERRAARRAEAAGDEEDDEDPFEGLVRPRGIVPTSSASGFRALRQLPPRRQAVLAAVVLVLGAAVLVSVQRRADSRPWWSAKVNLTATVDEVRKLTVLRLPLGEATAEHLTLVHRQRAAARAAGQPAAGYSDAEDVRYTGEDTDSRRGSVSVFASNGLWAAASREPDGRCLWALVGTSGWAELYRAGPTATCTAADAVRGAPGVVELYRDQQRTTTTTGRP